MTQRWSHVPPIHSRAQAPLLIHTPHALPMFREPRPTGKRKREKERADPIKSQMPDRGGAAPLKPGTGGKIGATGGTSAHAVRAQKPGALPDAQTMKGVLVGSGLVGHVIRSRHSAHTVR